MSDKKRIDTRGESIPDKLRLFKFLVRHTPIFWGRQKRIDSTPSATTPSISLHDKCVCSIAGPVSSNVIVRESAAGQCSPVELSPKALEEESYTTKRMECHIPEKPTTSFNVVKAPIAFYKLEKVRSLVGSLSIRCIGTCGCPFDNLT